jgi:hypothetical protein
MHIEEGRANKIGKGSGQAAVPEIIYIFFSRTEWNLVELTQTGSNWSLSRPSFDSNWLKPPGADVNTDFPNKGLG